MSSISTAPSTTSAPSAKTASTLHLISHTHWDREWYLTFQQFRFRLVQLIDRLMDLMERDPDFRYFHLDAQTICVEDYLAVKPGNRERLLRLIREGRILTGPWYEQNDVFLTSGEATIRNLLVGHRMAEEYGGRERVMKIGYLPDQFGLNSQMPQILRGFGISTAVHGRGLDMPRETGQMEYFWEAPDGSRVLTSYLAFWYNNFERVPEDLDAAVRFVDALERKMEAVSSSKHLLFMNGVDHFEAQADLSERIRAINAAREGGCLVQSTLEDYFHGLEEVVRAGSELPVHRGELRDGPSLGGLPGTLSSRVELKQMNARCQTLLERYVEPLASIAWRLGEDYPQEYLTYAWKLLMQNHPHDSICGCSQNQVHREMIPRFEQVKQLCDEMIDRSFSAVARQLPEPAAVDVPGRHTTFAVFNPLSFPRTDIVDATIDFPLGKPGRDKPEVKPETDVEFIRLFDDAGQPVPYHVVKSEVVTERVLSPTVLPMSQTFRRFTVQVRAADVPPLGFRAFRAVGQDWALARGSAGSIVATGAADSQASLVPGLHWMKNGRVEVGAIAGGSFQISLNLSGDAGGQISFEEMGFFEDGGDVGDQYVYRAPRRDVVLSTRTGSGVWELVEDTPLAAAWRARLTMEVPASALPARDGRTEERVTVPIETTVRLRADQPYVEVTTTVHNTAKDHRLRVLFPTVYQRAYSNLETLELPGTTVAQAPFDVVERTQVPPERLGVVAGQHPQEQWVSVSVSGERWAENEPAASGVAILVEGLYEHELLRDDERSLAITLLRCTDRLEMAEEGPLGSDRAPDAQEIGTHTFRYAVLPHTGDWEKERVWKYAHAFNAPLRAMQTPSADRGNPDLNRPYVGARRSALRIPSPALGRDGVSFLTLEPETLVLSAYKRANDRDTQIIRFWNIGTKEETGLVGIPGAKAAWRVNMNEERQESLPIMEGGAVAVTVRPREIVTLEIEGSDE